jgi:hypothetical protein
MDGLAQESGFARPGRGENIQDQEPARVEETAITFRQAVILAENRLPHFEDAMGVGNVWGVLIMRMRMGVTMRVRVRMVMVLAVVMAWAICMPVLMSMVMMVIMAVLMIMMMSTDTNRIFSGQSAAAFFTHYPISKEASSISLPARSSPLGLWQAGHSLNRSSA